MLAVTATDWLISLIVCCIALHCIALHYFVRIAVSAGTVVGISAGCIVLISLILCCIALHYFTLLCTCCSVGGDSSGHLYWVHRHLLSNCMVFSWITLHCMHCIVRVAVSAGSVVGISGGCIVLISHIVCCIALQYFTLYMLQ